MTLVSIYILVGFIFVIFVDLGIYILCKAYNENCDSYATNYQFLDDFVDNYLIGSCIFLIIVSLLVNWKPKVFLEGTPKLR